jgi:2-amino-4-hydroxy-6-hydroxymethyldihydropteridine diphosphokinase
MRRVEDVILIALGANLPSPAGTPTETLRQALFQLAERKITIEKQSGFYKTAAWPDPADPPFINAVARVRTKLDPSRLLAVLHEIEAQFGRRRGTANAPRTLDLDIIDYHQRVEQGPPELPHPRMHTRLFVLCPLRDVAPAWRHPVLHASVSELIRALPHEQIERVA